MYTLPLLSLVFVQLLSLVTAQNEITIKVMEKIKFGQSIAVKFTNPNPLDTNWLGVYNSTVEDPAIANDLMWMYMCGNQDEGCAAKEKGTAVFKIAGNDTTSALDYPLNPGKYKVCLMDANPREDEVSEVLKCSPFQVEALNNALVTSSSVTPSKLTYTVGETISASYESKTKTPNVWIGIFTSDEIFPSSEPVKVLPNDDSYVYAACNNKEGNTGESEMCSKRTRRGFVDFTQESPPANTYVLCMCFNANKPYNKFVCSDEFIIKDDNTSTEASIKVESPVKISDPIKVSFYNPSATVDNWIGIYEGDSTDYETDLFWSLMCGGQEGGCAAKEVGSVTFSSDPDVDSFETWPSSSGEKKVCIMLDDNSPYQAVACETFTITELPSGMAVTGSSADVGCST
jgi:hypothetical protein